MALLGKILLAATFLPLPLAVFLLGGWNYYYDYFTHQAPADGQQVYDYIIVGSGSAGAPLANRLSKNSRVLLLEAGGDPLPMSFIPMFFPMIMNRPETDWMHETVPQEGALGLVKGRGSKWARGKSLGGTSNANALLYVRGHPLDYENWANLTGDDAWRYENLLPAFKRSLDYHGAYAGNTAHYGEGSPYGHLHIEPIPPEHLSKYWFDAGREMGYEHLDLNGPQRAGFGGLDLTRKNGKRCSTYSAFLEPILDRKNLVISRYSQATKIHLDKNNRAIGVWYVRHGVTRYAGASREIIVSAGALDSPKLLMLSGIGPKKHLQSVGIRPRVDLPVGQNLHDHLVAPLLNILIDKPLSYFPDEEFGLSAWTDYFFKGTGPLSSTWPAAGQCFIPSSQVPTTGPQANWPDIQLVAAGLGISNTAHLEFEPFMGLDPVVLKEFFRESVGHHALNIMTVLSRPKSRGEIRLRDKNPLSPLHIDPHYLEDPRDVRILVEALQFTVKMVETTRAFKELGARLAPVPLPPCKHLPFKADAYFECYARHMAGTTFHPVGTCRMGAASDPRTVVDSNLRVKGVHGLRVADASIMPEITNGNTNAPAIMIGEKAAEMVRDYWATQFLVCDKFEFIFGSLARRVQQMCHYSKLG